MAGSQSGIYSSAPGLDLFFPDQNGIKRAYSWNRRIVRRYTGPLINIRRSSDDATMDIPQSGKFIDQAAILSFIGPDNAFIVTAYDQTGRGGHITNATLSGQPQIAVSGVINKDAIGRIFIDTLSTMVFLRDVSTITLLTQPGAQYIVSQKNGAGVSNGIILARGNVIDDNWLTTLDTAGNVRMNAGTVLIGSASDNDKHLHSMLFNGANSELRKDSQTDVVGDAGTNNSSGLTLGADLAETQAVNANVYELLCYGEADKSTVGVKTEDNLIDFYFNLPSQENLARGWSISRRVLIGYTGNLIRVRRSSDNAELDIGQDADGNLDQAALLAHVGANDGFVVTIYEQIGTGVDPTTATAGDQPRIVLAGVVNTTFQGRVYADTLGSSSLQSTIGTVSQPGAWFSAFHRQGSLPGTEDLFSRGTSNPDPLWILRLNAVGNTIFNAGLTLTGPPPDTDQHIYSGIVDGVNSEVYIDSNLVVSGNAGTQSIAGLSLFADNSKSNPSDLHFHELLFYEGDTTPSRVNIENNQFEFYFNQNVIPEQTNLVRAYSFNRHVITDYLGPILRVRRDSDNAEKDIYKLRNGFIDKDEIKDFVGIANGFAVTIYDQTTAGRDLSQGTLGDQPLIVSAGNLNEDADGRIYIDTQGSSFLHNDVVDNIVQPGTVFLVAHRQGSVASSEEYFYRRAAGGGGNWSIETSGTYRLFSGTDLIGPASDTIEHIFTALFDGASSELFIDSSSVVSGNAGTSLWSSITLGATFIGTQPVDAFIYEMLVYNADKSSSRLSIEGNLNGTYKVF